MSEIPLPPRPLRMGGARFRTDQQYVAGALRDVRRLVGKAGLGPDSRVLDWGCGAGRLAVGIKSKLGVVRDYHGVDLQPELIEWAVAHLADEHTRFTLVDQHNARYNPGGSASFDIPAEDGSVDVFYSYSVFSHMLADDIAGYSRTIARLLAPAGRGFFTAFVEDGVPDCEENPDGYVGLEMSGRLHVVRYHRPYFEGLLWESGLRVEEFAHGSDTDGQSSYVVTRRG